MKHRILYGIITCLLSLPVFASAENEVEVWVASAWQRVLRGSAPAGPAAAILRAASNEYEPFRLIVHNGGKEKLTGLTVEAGDLNSGSQVVPAENIRLYRAYYLHITRPSKRTENPAGWYPDALIPFQDSERDKEAAGGEFIAVPFEVDAGQNAEVWCDLYVPAGTSPGMYRGKVTVYAGKRKLAVVPVELTVRDFELPEKIAMRSNFGPLRDRNLEFMGLEPKSPGAGKLEALYHEALISHRAMPGTPEHYWPEWNEADGIIEKGEGGLLRELVEEKHVTALRLPLRHEDDPSTCRAWLSAAGRWLRETGYLDLAYVYLEDEPNSAEEYEIVRRQGALIGSAEPDIDRLCTEQTIPTKPEWGDLYGAVDIWCPLWGLWDEKTARQRLEKGEELWSYTALCQGAAGTPWWQIDMDPLNFRSPFWLSWHYDITGFLYWSSTYWSAYGSPEGAWRGPFFREDFWGEGMLLYPGKPAGIEGFVPSIRLKLIREALEDYEYMAMAAGLGHEDEVNRIVGGLVSDFQHWSRNPADYGSARERLAELIARDTRQALVLGAGKKTRYQLIVPGECGETVRQSAGLIREAFLANGMDLPVVSEDRDDPSRPGIYLGDTRFARNHGIEPSRFEGWSYLHKAAGRDLIIAGSNDGTRFGVIKGICDFLREYAGVRFLYPGETGTEFLEMPVISVPADLDLAVTPMLQFNYSGDMYPGEWLYNIANNHFPAAFKLGGRVHSWGPAIPADKYYKTHPEYFALIKGERVGPDQRSQYCISNPDVMELIIRDMVRLADEGNDVVYLGQPDSFDPCECEKCYELYGTGEDWNEKVWLFNREIAERFEKRCPGKKILMLAYQANNNPPRSIKRFPDNAFIELHHGHDIALNEWSESGVEFPGGFFLVPRLFGSHYVVNYLPKRTPGWLEERVKLFHNVEMDVVGLRPMEAIDCYGLEGPAYYVFGRMFDDPANNRAEDLVEEFYTAAFGEAVDPMRRFYSILHERLRFCSEWFFPRSPGRFFIGLDRKPIVTKIDDQLDWVRESIVMLETGFHRSIPAKLPEMGYSLNYTPDLVLQMEQELEKAEALATTDKVRKRLELVRVEFMYMKNAMRIIYLYNAWKIDPQQPALSRLLDELDAWDAMLDSYFDEKGSMTASIQGWPEIRPFRGTGRPALGLVKARWWVKKEKENNPFAWDIEEIRKSGLLPR